MKTMYKGIPFSPRATLTQEINGSATVIPVSDVNAFPEAPNLATIGTDDVAETILYSAKTENALSGCTRGVEGSAKTWSAGSIIARNFTAVEYGYIIDNIQQLFNEQEFTARINEEGHLIITLGTGTEIDCGNAKGDRGPTGPAGTNGNDGADGEDGGYYKPAVDGSGNLTWTASKSGMPAVSGANIKGATGPQGPAGKEATINGVNALTLEVVEGAGIVGTQTGTTFKIDATELFQSVSEGKSAIAAAITDKGVTTAADATFQTMATNIGAISGGSFTEVENLEAIIMGLESTSPYGTGLIELDFGESLHNKVVIFIGQMDTYFHIDSEGPIGPLTFEINVTAVSGGDVYINIDYSGINYRIGIYVDYVEFNSDWSGELNQPTIKYYIVN